MKCSRVLAAVVFVVVSACMAFGEGETTNSIVVITYSGGKATVISPTPISPNEVDGKKKNYTIPELRDMADKNDPEGLHLLGMRYANGDGVRRNKDLGFSMVEKAADMGYIPAVCDLGYLYYAGRGTTRNLEKAFELFMKAANENHPFAQNNVGAMYENGEYVHKNIKEAINWYTKAAMQGNIIAQRNLGAIYEEGKGIQKNPTEAAKWYKMAADQGDAESKKALGRLNTGPKPRY